jgi:hypothetical protein
MRNQSVVEVQPNHQPLVTRVAMVYSALTPSETAGYGKDGQMGYRSQSGRVEAALGRMGGPRPTSHAAAGAF